MSTQSIASALLPSFALRKLQRSRGNKWARLVEGIAQLPETHPQHLAYTLMIRRLFHLVHTSARRPCFRPGCALCALETLELYQGSERELLETYDRTLAEVQDCLGVMEEARKAAA
jgi:hypothetical protein